MEPKKMKIPKKKKATLSTIDKSRRLQQSTRTRRSKATDLSKALVGNKRKCIPPLSVLERMYEDSDEEMAETPAVNSDPQQNKSSLAIDANLTSAQPTSSTSSNVPISPTTAKKYADELLKILDSEAPPPQPVIPMKRYKKPKVPYIVGCTERPKVQESKNLTVFKGDDYGITSKTNAMPNDCDVDEPGFYSGGYNLCKSAFNAQANEIAARLLSVDNSPINVGCDSDDTVVYEVIHPPNRFSPQPSTSRDDETMFKNDLKLDRYFNNKNVIKKDEPPAEVIVLDDAEDHLAKTPGEAVNTKPNVCVKSEIDTVIEIEDDVNEISNVSKSANDVKEESKRCVQAHDSPIIVDGTNLNSLNGNMIIDEIDLTNIDVNDLISKSKSLINRHRKRNTLYVINVVPTEVAVPVPTDNTESVKMEQVTDKNIQQSKCKSPVNEEPPCKKPFLGTCPICLDNLSESTIASTTCGHLFCLDCLKQVVKPKFKKCPTCRKRLTGAGYHKIYL